MKNRTLLRSPILGALALALSLLSCGREVTGPGGGRMAGAVQLRPVFRALQVSERLGPVQVNGLVEFVRVRVVLLRANGDTALTRVVEFPADSQSIALTLPVVLSANAGSEGETLDASLRFVNAAGDTVFRGGPIAVQARVSGAPTTTPPEIPVTYSGPGATAASLAITPRNYSGGAGATVSFGATVRDAQGGTLAGTPVAFLSSDTTLVQVGLRTGVATLRGLKGQAMVYATTLTGQRDSASVTVVAPPAQMGYLTQPAKVAAGTVLPAVRVAVLDAARDTVRGAVGTMRVALTGGTTGAVLGGTTRVAVEGGIARFSDLTVDRAGSGYRLVATLDSVSGVPAATSDTFSIGEAPLPSNGPPLLYVGTEVASLGVGRSAPITAYLSNPAREPTAITLRSRSDSIAQWTTSTITIPFNGTQGTGTLSGRARGTTWVVLESAVGTDSIQVTVDSAGMRFGPLPTRLLVTDTIRTVIALDAPAPTGGLTVTVRSADPARVRVAPGSGTGVLEQPVPEEWATLQAMPTDEGTLLAPPAETATLTIPAGRLSAQLVVVPILAGTDSTATVALTATAAGVSRAVSSVVPLQPVLDLRCFSCEIALGHTDGMQLWTPAPRRSPLVVRLSTPDTAILRVTDSIVTVPVGDYYTDLQRAVVGRSLGTGRLIATAAGFPADTVTVAVRPGAVQLASYNGAELRVGTQLDLRAAFGWSEQEDFVIYGAPRADSLVVTMTSSDTLVAVPEFTRRVLPAGAYEVRLPVVGRQPGLATFTVSAPGYAPGAFAVEVTDGITIFLDAPATTGIGISTPVVINTPSFTATRLTAMEFTVTSSDTTVLRVLTPRLTLASGRTSVEARVEGVAAGSAVVTVRRDGVAVATFTTQVRAPQLAIPSTPERLDAGEASEVLVLTEAEVSRSTTALLTGTLRSTDPTVLVVTDSVLRFVPGEFGAIGVVRGVGAGTARLIASAPGFPPDTSAVITVGAPRLVVPLDSGAVRVGPGITWVFPVERQSATLGALPFTIAVTGSAGSAPVIATDTFPAGAQTRTIRVRGGSATGTDTLRVTAAGLAVGTYRLQAAPSWLTLASETTVPVEVAFEVGGGLAMTPGFVDDSLTLRPVASAPLRYRLVSLDTAILRIIDDTLEIADGASFATRLGRARGLRPGTARLTATRLGSGGPVVDTIAVEVTPARLFHSAFMGKIELGMQQQTEESEVYISRNIPTKTPTWVRLQSSAPSVVSVPDSILIPAEALGASVVVTARDTVGAARITAQAIGHEGASFDVTVTRAQIVVSTFGGLVAGGRLESDAFVIAGGPNEDFGWIIRRHSAPLTFRLTSSDTSVVRWASATATIPVGAPWVTLTARGGRMGTSRVAVEDPRTTFVQLSGVDRTMEVRPGVLRVTGGMEMYGGLPLLQAGVGLTSSPRGLEVQTNGERAGLTVKFRSLRNRVGFAPDSLVLRGYWEHHEEGDSATIGVRGLVAGVDTVEVSALGYRPDTMVVRVDQGYLEPAEPLATTTLRTGDSTLVRLVFRAPNGDAARPTEAMLLSITTSATLAVSGTGVSGGTPPLVTLAVPAGATEAQFWVKGVSAGAARLTVAGPAIRMLELQGAVRAP
jgi:hypothetical protein